MSEYGSTWSPKDMDVIKKYVIKVLKRRKSINDKQILETAVASFRSDQELLKIRNKKVNSADQIALMYSSQVSPENNARIKAFLQLVLVDRNIKPENDRQVFEIALSRMRNSAQNVGTTKNALPQQKKRPLDQIADQDRQGSDSSTIPQLADLPTEDRSKMGKYIHQSDGQKTDKQVYDQAASLARSPAEYRNWPRVSTSAQRNSQQAAVQDPVVRASIILEKYLTPHDILATSKPEIEKILAKILHEKKGLNDQDAYNLAVDRYIDELGLDEGSVVNNLPLGKIPAQDAAARAAVILAKYLKPDDSLVASRDDIEKALVQIIQKDKDLSDQEAYNFAILESFNFDRSLNNLVLGV
jgi:hypothetical protein